MLMDYLLVIYLDEGEAEDHRITVLLDNQQMMYQNIGADSGSHLESTDHKEQTHSKHI